MQWPKHVVMRVARHGFVFCLGLLICFGITCPAGATETPLSLFFDAPGTVGRNSAISKQHDEQRVRLTHLDSELLCTLKTKKMKSARVRLNLFSDTRPHAVIYCVESNRTNSATWRGQIEGVPGSQVILVVHGDVIAGSVFIPGKGAYQIQYAGNGLYRIVEIGSETKAGCGAELRTEDSIVSAATSAATTRSISKAGPADDPPAAASIIDLLVVYTAAARNGAGGRDGIEAVIDTAVVEANLSLENSRVSARFRLVHKAEIDYIESGSISEDLEELTEDEDDGLEDDGRVHGVHQLRRQFQADLVCMFTEGTGTTIGLANIMHDVDPAFAKYAFSVVRRQFANTYFTLAHETGHNLGCQHDRANATGSGVFPYSYGYRFAANGTNYHDVMASQSGGGLPIAHYSNPAVKYLGAATGIAESSPQAANNAKTICLTAETAAGFRLPALSTLMPSIILTEPVSERIYWSSNAISCVALANDPDGQVVRVEFFADDSIIGVATGEPFVIRWTNPALGEHTLTARAVDDLGASTLSAPINIRISEPFPMPSAEGSRLLSDGRFQLHIIGLTGQNFRVDSSRDLGGWTPVLTNSLTGNSYDFFDDGAPALKERFYRVIPLE